MWWLRDNLSLWKRALVAFPRHVFFESDFCAMKLGKFAAFLPIFMSFGHKKGCKWSKIDILPPSLLIRCSLNDKF